MTGKKDSSLSLSIKSPILNKMMNLKAQLRFYLNAKEMSAAHLAKKASVPKQSLSGWLGGSNPRDIQQIKRVAEILGTSVDNLMFGHGFEKNELKAIELETLLGDGWITGLFEIKFRRINK